MLENADREDLIFGFIYGAATYFFIGYWAIIPAILSSFFWWKAGRDSSSWKVYGCTASCYIPILIQSYKIMVLLPVVAAAIVISFGYGIPAKAPFDKGSFLGRLFFKLTDEDDFWSNFLTRGSIYLGLGLCYLWAYMIY